MKRFAVMAFGLVTMSGVVAFDTNRWIATRTNDNGKLSYLDKKHGGATEVPDTIENLEIIWWRSTNGTFQSMGYFTSKPPLLDLSNRECVVIHGMVIPKLNDAEWTTLTNSYPVYRQRFIFSEK